MTQTQTVPIELGCPGAPAVVYAAAGDTGSRFVAMQLYDAGAPYTPPAGISCLIGWQQGARRGTYRTIAGAAGARSAWALNGSTLTIELAPDLCAHAGDAAVNVALIDADGSRLHTWALLCRVAASAVADAEDPALPSETASSAADRAEAAAARALQAANLLAGYAAQAEAAADRAEAAAPQDGTVLSVNGKGGAVVLDAGDVGALAEPAAPAAGGLLAVAAVDAETGAVSTQSIPVDGAHGVEITSAGLQIIPAAQAQLAAMADGWAPIVPALLPLAVKLALGTAWASAAWTDADRAAARTLLGAASAAETASQLASLLARVNALEQQGGSGGGTVDQAYAADLGTLAGLTMTGVWNQTLERIEF